jgi:hypothetical protein
MREGADYICLAQDKNGWRTLVNTVLNFRFHKMRTFLTTWSTISFSRRMCYRELVIVVRKWLAITTLALGSRQSRSAGTDRDPAPPKHRALPHTRSQCSVFIIKYFISNVLCKLSAYFVFSSASVTQQGAVERRLRGACSSGGCKLPVSYFPLLKITFWVHMWRW